MSESSEAASRPVECYRFEISGYEPMLFTSDEDDQTAEGDVYEALPGLSNSGLNIVTFGEDSADFTVTVPATSLLARRCGLITTPQSVHLSFRRYQRTDMDTPVMQRDGAMDSASTKNNSCTLFFPDAFTAGLAPRIPKNRLQTLCNWNLGDSNCGKDISAMGANVTQIAEAIQFTNSTPGRYVVQAEWFGDADDVRNLLGGTISGVFDAVTEHRTIQAITAFMSLTGLRAHITTSRPFAIPLAGSTFTIRPGCNGSWIRCAFLENTIRFGGFQFVPTERENPFVKRLDNQRKT
jgi:hypothetical protein